jgi:hypothetical protein
MKIAEENTQSYANLQRTGLQVCNYLFSYLNFIAGYHTLNDKSITTYPHVLIVIEEFQRLADKLGNDLRVINFIDNLALRLYNDEGWRNHFPVIIETNMNR